MRAHSIVQLLLRVGIVAIFVLQFYSTDVKYVVPTHSALLRQPKRFMRLARIYLLKTTVPREEVLHSDAVVNSSSRRISSWLSILSRFETDTRVCVRGTVDYVRSHEAFSAYVTSLFYNQVFLKLLRRVSYVCSPRYKLRPRHVFPNSLGSMHRCVMYCSFGMGLF